MSAAFTADLESMLPAATSMTTVTWHLSRPYEPTHTHSGAHGDGLGLWVDRWMAPQQT